MVTKPHAKKEPIMKDYTTMYVGIDAHKKKHQVNILNAMESEGSECTVKNIKREIQ